MTAVTRNGFRLMSSGLDCDAVTSGAACPVRLRNTKANLNASGLRQSIAKVSHVRRLLAALLCGAPLMVQRDHSPVPGGALRRHAGPRRIRSLRPFPSD